QQLRYAQQHYQNHKYAESKKIFIELSKSLDPIVKQEAKTYLEKLKNKLKDDNISNQKVKKNIKFNYQINEYQPGTNFSRFYCNLEIMKIENGKKDYLSNKDYEDFKVIDMGSKKENDSFGYYEIGKPFHILNKDKKYEAIYKNEKIFYVINGKIKEIK
ncbi:13754_t:CDS:1, partial [Gigaspora margarita]